jgi:glycosyltransferase involved in cell wall biosynthesis
VPTIPLVSVIVPVYNQEQFLGRCLRSLKAQDFPREDYEVVVIDDGSSDGTGLILDLHRKDIRILRNEVNAGLPAALNMGIRSSSSLFTVRVDSDDYVNAEFIRVLYTFLAQNQYMDAVACDYYLVDDSETVLERRNCDDHPIACGIMFRTDQLIDVGLYDEDFLLHEDRDLRLRFLERHCIHRIEAPLYRYRRHSGNITNNVEEMARHFDKLLDKHGEQNA